MFKIISLIIVSAIFIYLQIYICKKSKNKKIGLILPIGCFILSLLTVISIILVFISNFLIPNNDFNDIFIYDSLIYIIIILIIYTIILFMPSIIFMLIYLHYQKNS